MADEQKKSVKTNQQDKSTVKPGGKTDQNVQGQGGSSSPSQPRPSDANSR